MRKFHNAGKEWLTREEVSVYAREHSLHFALIRPRGARPWEGFASILQHRTKGGVVIRRDISRIEVTEAAWWAWVERRGGLGVYHYVGANELGHLLHVGYLPGHYPRGGQFSLARRLRRRRQAAKGGRVYRGYRQKP
jgi:hypothetical protein